MERICDRFQADRQVQRLNLAGAFATTVRSDMITVASKALGKVEDVKGRFERIDSDKGFMVVVDYAHSPDSLQKTLQSAREILDSAGKGGRLITVFGCGGNRDRTKTAENGKDRRRLERRCNSYFGQSAVRGRRQLSMRYLPACSDGPLREMSRTTKS